MPVTQYQHEFPVVGVGASAGGLDAFSRLLAAISDSSGKAFILVQHLDPQHESLLVDLLSAHTSLQIEQAAEGMLVEPDHIYIIPPGTYLAVRKSALHISRPSAKHGARLPFDFLLKSLAENYGPRAMAVVLSGTGSDGSVGIREIKAKGGIVYAQDPDEAEYEGMPECAIETGCVDATATVAAIGRLLSKRIANPPAQSDQRQLLTAIIELLRETTPHDFRLYKTGTLKRRIERRMLLANIQPEKMADYLEKLKQDQVERDLLAKDLLINVTSFFRDPKVFETLCTRIVPDLIANHPANEPLRIWVAGCSTGEEAYSFAIVFREALTGLNSRMKLQVFASDVDADAVGFAREGIYPATIAADVSSERLARFFVAEGQSYRVTRELRSSVVFSVQDILSDPPFSRLDLVSCRNLLIYLSPEAQAKVIAILHFALRKGGVLLLGNAETVANVDGRFEILSKDKRIYRHLGRTGLAGVGFHMNADNLLRLPPGIGQRATAKRHASLADFSEQQVLDRYSPAAALINHKQECLYTLGPVERYLQIAPGHPTHDLLAMVAPALRARLRTALQSVGPATPSVVKPGGKIDNVPFNIAVHSVDYEGEDLRLVCFLDAPMRHSKVATGQATSESGRIAELEKELQVTRSELQVAINSLEMSVEEQHAINEEALSVNEEFQSTNEELLTSKEELQSLNEELNALNSQLQESLERQRMTSNDLQNVLYSTDVATLFLDMQFNIRFFTPATRALFSIIASDIGRPLSDLNSLASDTALLEDARTVLESLEPIEREIQVGGDTWFVRRIMPYRTDNGVEGVVITFTDISERRHAAKIVDEAKKAAERATVAKSRFLAVASHDLRQPLQTLSLLQGLLAKSVEGEKPQRLVARLDETLGAMTGMINTLLDINQIEAGTITTQISRFAISELLDQLRDEFSYHAKAKKLELRVVQCSVVVQTDRRLLEQMLRNLLSNALKYTERGRILMGCRRMADGISIEILDAGIGIAPDQIHAIFDEYHQVDNTARERSRGLGLGLSIVQRLGKLLGHPVRVRSVLGKGSAFAVEVKLPLNELVDAPSPAIASLATNTHRTANILIVEDDPEVRLLLEQLLSEEGHIIAKAVDGKTAVDFVKSGKMQPDLVLADYNLPNKMNGLQLAAKLRTIINGALPVIILTGDILTETMREVAAQNCVQLNKPVKVGELSKAIQKLLAQP